MAISRPCYCTREDVKRALDIAETARADAQVDRALEAASDGIDGGPNRIAGLLKRRFYPEVRTHTFDWPSDSYSRPWRLWLDQHTLISVDTLVAGGVTVSSDDYFLRPDDGPPFTHVEIDLASSAAFASGDTHQRAISITGLYGDSDDEAAAGELAEALDASETTVDVTDSAAVGVGDLLRVDEERMLVTGRRMLDTGQNLGANLDASASTVTVAVTDGSLYQVDEVILVDSERMLVVDIAGNNLTVKRAWDGSVLASHSAGADIFAPRTLVVERGAVGTTAATHISGAGIARHVVPGLVRNLCVAESIEALLQETSGYAREVGSGESAREASGRALRLIREQAWVAYGRKGRKRAV